MNASIFEQINSLVFKEPEQKLLSVTPGQKNIELKFIILKKIDQQLTKQHKKITKYLIADQSASAHLNVYDIDENILKAGDIYYLSGAYATLFKGKMNIHQGKFGLLKKIDEYFLQFNVHPNVSLKNWEDQFVQ